jgi:hypothetical protein
MVLRLLDDPAVPEAYADVADELPQVVDGRIEVAGDRFSGTVLGHA